jgi:hypothetical protein
MRPSNRPRWSIGIAFGALAILAVVQGPLLIRSPLGPDPVLYDLQARLITTGGVLYQDILEPNLPGAAWLHAIVRSVAGWSSEALRLADLLLFTIAAITLAALITRSASQNQQPRLALQLLTILLLVGAYMTLNEWCHCQRDLWTLPFALWAILIRTRRELDDESPARTAWLSVAEGALWGCGVWLKPHIIIPALAVIAASWISRSQAGRTRVPLALPVPTQEHHSIRTGQASGTQQFFISVAIDSASLLTGGLAIGLLGITWLVQTGAWPHFWSMLTEWNADYVAASANRWSWSRLWAIQEHLAPWSLIHVAAIPMALLQCWRLIRWGGTPRMGVEWVFHRLRRPFLRFDHALHSPRSLRAFHPQAKNNDLAKPGHTSSPSTAILSAAYLGWLTQAFFLQHLFDYVYAPTLILGAAVVITSIAPRLTSLEFTPRRVAFAAVACLALPLSQRIDQLHSWRDCLTANDTPKLRTALTRLPLPDWVSLAKVANFLKSQHIADGELTAYHTHTIHLYPWLGISPSTRFVFTETHLRLFPNHVQEIEDSLKASRERFIVVSLLEAGVDPAVALDDSTPDGWRTACPPDAIQKFPFCEPVVFRAGPYVVHQATSDPGSLETGFFPLAKSAGL